MLSAGPLFLLSASLLVLYSLVTSLEERRQERFILKSLRSGLDVMVTTVFLYLQKKLRYIVRHTIKLSWYYSLHSALRAVLTLLVGIYDRLEGVFIQNRERARGLRAEKKAMLKEEANHLTVISEHKASMALTPNQKKKLRAKKLERD
jgi:hypothetical protein